jgi:basic membrane lipoprotein Med (substrate-binding protein (PBP1-ABC) superfamily)
VRFTCPKCRIDTIDLAGTEATEFARGEGVKYAALGADVIFAAAGASGDAALLDAAQVGAFVVGSGNDVFVTVFGGGSEAGADRVLTSVYLAWEAALGSALQDFADGSSRSGVEPLSLANGGVVMAPLRDPDGVLSLLDQQDIESTKARLADRSLETGVDPLTGQER